MSSRTKNVYGGFWIKAFRGTVTGRLVSALIASPPFSRFDGSLHDRLRSKRKLKPFIEKFDIQMTEFLPEYCWSADVPCSIFNHFFTRQVTESARPFAQAGPFPAPYDARYFAYSSVDDDVSIPLKGSFFQASALLNHLA